MAKTFEPMKAATAKKLEDVRLPKLGSPKFDGFRAVVRDGVLLSKNLKPIRNKYTQSLFGRHLFDGLDGELIVGQPTAPDVFSATSSGVTSTDGEPDVRFYAFDLCDQSPHDTFERRFTLLKSWMSRGRKLHRVELVPHESLTSLDQVLRMEERLVNDGYEGMMLRDPLGLYKWGRSTLREEWLLKVKRFEDGEAVVEGFEEFMHNGNVAIAGVRSHKKSGLKPMGMLGSLKVRGINGKFKGATFNVGAGFTMSQRAKIWSERHLWMRGIIRYKFFPIGSVDAPRFPTFAGVRDSSDL